MAKEGSNVGGVRVGCSTHAGGRQWRSRRCKERDPLWESLGALPAGAPRNRQPLRNPPHTRPHQTHRRAHARTLPARRPSRRSCGCVDGEARGGGWPGRGCNADALPRVFAYMRGTHRLQPNCRPPPPAAADGPLRNTPVAEEASAAVPVHQLLLLRRVGAVLQVAEAAEGQQRGGECGVGEMRGHAAPPAPLQMSAVSGWVAALHSGTPRARGMTIRGRSGRH